MNIHFHASAEDAKRAVAKILSEELLSLKEEAIPTLLLFSGGSSLGILDLLDPGCPGDFLTVSPIDERYDPSGHDSNFAAFNGTDFFHIARTADTRFIDTRVRSGQSHDDLALAFDRTLGEWGAEHPDGRTLGILGMGPDGHTAGIFPMDDESAFRTLFLGERLAVGYRGPEYATCPERVTVTLSFLARDIDRIFVFFSGEEKRAIWERLTKSEIPLHVLPAGIFRRLPDVEIFTDLR